MGEESKNNVLYMDDGNGFQPLGEVVEIDCSEEKQPESRKPLDFYGKMNMTFTCNLSWWSRVKLWWMIDGKFFLKRLFCKHYWIIGHETDGRKWRCYCPKCGKWKNRDILR